MTVHILVAPGQEAQAEVTKFDILFSCPSVYINCISLDADPFAQVAHLGTLNYEAGDVILIAGVCPRVVTFEIAKIAIEKKQNYMPGKGVDHRGVELATGIFKQRLPIENNNYTVWPYIAVIGNPESAKLSFQLVALMDQDEYWSAYKPEIPTLLHLLAVLLATGLWESPDWFELVDMSNRDLDISSTMYTSNVWDEWISFYPANKNFKLENHAQIRPVWLDGSEKPLEYWKR